MSEDDRLPPTRDLASALQRRLPTVAANRPDRSMPSASSAGTAIDDHADAGEVPARTPADPPAISSPPPVEPRPDRVRSRPRPAALTPAGGSAGGAGPARTVSLTLSAAADDLLTAQMGVGERLAREVIVTAVNTAYQQLAARRGSVPSDGPLPVVGRARRRLERPRHRAVRFTTVEADALTSVAAEQGMSVSALVTDALIAAYGSPTPPR